MSRPRSLPPPTATATSSQAPAPPTTSEMHLIGSQLSKTERTKLVEHALAEEHAAQVRKLHARREELHWENAALRENIEKFRLGLRPPNSVSAILAQAKLEERQLDAASALPGSGGQEHATAPKEQTTTAAVIFSPGKSTAAGAEHLLVTHRHLEQRLKVLSTEVQLAHKKIAEAELSVGQDRAEVGCPLEQQVLVSTSLSCCLGDPQKDRRSGVERRTGQGGGRIYDVDPRISQLMD